MLESLIFVAACVAQLAYWAAFDRGFRHAREREAEILAQSPGGPSPATVVVAARNESLSLPALLRSLAAQDHPTLNLVFVDDASTDATAETVEAALHEHEGHESARPTSRPVGQLVRIVTPREPRKKNALAEGIAVAPDNILLFTDADCEPPSAWATSLCRLHGGSNGRVVVGYSPFRRGDGLLNGFARYETFISGFSAAAAIGLGHPYTATGRSMSYTKELFESVGGFSEIMKSLSGDDDLMLQYFATATSSEVVHAFGSETHVMTGAPSSWKAWTRQKLRHTSAGRFYRSDIKWHLLAYHTTSTVTWLSPLVLGWVGAALIAARQVYQFVVLRSAASILDETDLMPLQPAYEFLYAVYNVLLAPLGVLIRPRRW